MVEDYPRLGALALAGQLRPALDEAGRDAGPEGAWRRGWLLAAMGRYGEAFDELAAAAAGPRTLAAACGTRGSVLRQVGLHGRAEGADREGARLLADGGRAEVVAGLRVGLVADAVGAGAPPAELEARLREAADAVGRTRSVRQGVRLSWVTGEVAMLRGEPGPAATSFQQARRRCIDRGLGRHEAKSLLFLAAANAAAGDRQAAAAQAADALALATVCGAQPLRWPAMRVLAEVSGDSRSREDADRVRDALVASLPVELRGAARTAEPH